ncbi:MAG: hypothetical protein JST40_07050 [Armatimonadetes bacterium]|nr:hypothetical protein [Armatimonadota bacterium]
MVWQRYIPLVLMLAAVAIFAIRRLTKSKKLPSVTEYWIYITEPKLPNMNQVMTRMISGNPYNKPGKAIITTREGALFSDIRLNVGLVLRDKNPQLFRPDLFTESESPNASQLALLGQSKALIRVRYVSNVPLRDTRHLTFMPHLAGAYLDLSQGLVVYDPVSGMIWDRPEYATWLGEHPQLETAPPHTRLSWSLTPEGQILRIQGLLKLGLPDLQTPESPGDHATLIESLAELLLRRIWPKDEPANIPERVELITDLDRFEAICKPTKPTEWEVTFRRLT